MTAGTRARPAILGADLLIIILEDESDRGKVTRGEQLQCVRACQVFVYFGISESERTSRRTAEGRRSVGGHRALLAF